MEIKPCHVSINRALSGLHNFKPTTCFEFLQKSCSNEALTHTFQDLSLPNESGDRTRLCVWISFKVIIKSYKKNTPLEEILLQKLLKGIKQVIKLILLQMKAIPSRVEVPRHSTSNFHHKSRYKSSGQAIKQREKDEGWSWSPQSSQEANDPQMPTNLSTTNEENRGNPRNELATNSASASQPYF